MRTLLATSVILTILGGCTNDKNDYPPFTSERQYRHALYKGGYETIKFKPNGQVYAKMLVNGTEVEANGNYRIRKKHYIDVALASGPYRKIHFINPIEEELIESNRSFRWTNY
ncbi:hypothetical protein [Nibrella saemangeumensis]|uniref:hypothetical protein n=1 Tax=Nibrella saemangeumensis TaxID=1084526 RepID=UPI0031E58765